jgi:uncharacterized protein YukE
MDFLGDPGSIDRVASELTAAQGALARTESEVASAVAQLVPGSWHGAAASAFQGHWGTEASSMDALAGVATRMSSTLHQLAAELRHARSIAQQAEGVASAHGLAIGLDGQVGAPLSAGPFGLPPDPAQLQARAQAQHLMDEARRIAHDAQTRASGALSGLSVPQVLPGVSAQDARLWAQSAAAGRPGSPLSFGEDLWKALRGNVLPPSAGGDLGIGLWAFGRGLKLAGGTSGWMTKVVLGRFAPRDALGRFVSPADLSWFQRALQSTDGKSWIANPYAAGSRGAWSTAGRWAGRAGIVIGAGLSALGQWSQDAGKNMGTGERVTRSAYRGVVSGASAWGGAVAGTEVGAAVGSFIGPEGTVIGGLVGGIVGGVAGSGVGNWAVDHTVNAVGDAGETAVHAVGDAGSAAIHEAGHLLDDINPF